jgi:hypothetical protein
MSHNLFLDAYKMFIQDFRLIVTQLVNPPSPTFYAPRRFIAIFTTAPYPEPDESSTHIPTLFP